jgi:hypothetical protein
MAIGIHASCIRLRRADCFGGLSNATLGCVPSFLLFARPIHPASSRRYRRVFIAHGIAWCSGRPGDSSLARPESSCHIRDYIFSCSFTVVGIKFMTMTRLKAASIKINPILGFALLLLVAGCTSVTTSSLHCTSLAYEQQAHIYSDLNLMLINDGFTTSSASETPWGKAWSNDSFSPLWQGQAYFQVGAQTNSSGMDIDVFYYRGAAGANRALVGVILACVQSNAPNAAVKIKARTEFAPSFLDP